MSVYNASSLAYTKALKDLIDRDKKPAQKTGGLLQRNMPKKVVEEKKNSEPYDSVLDALDQVRKQRKALLNG